MTKSITVTFTQGDGRLHARIDSIPTLASTFSYTTPEGFEEGKEFVVNMVAIHLKEQAFKP